MAKVACEAWARSIPKIILLGDSLTQYCFSAQGGWGSLIADRLQRRCDVVSRGFSGYSTRMYRKVLPLVTSEFTVDRSISGHAAICCVTILLGANDSADATVNPTQHVPLLEYEENLEDMVNHVYTAFPWLKASKGVIIISPPPVNDAMWDEHCLAINSTGDRSDVVVAAYAAACRDVSARTGARFADLYGVAHNAGVGSSAEDNGSLTPAHFHTDGQHLDVDGAAMLGNVVWPHVKDLTKDLLILFPNWKEFDESFSLK